MRPAAVRLWGCLILLSAAGAITPALEAPVAGASSATPAGNATRLLPPAQWRRQQLLRVAVERYPELIEGDTGASVAVVGLALYPDDSLALGEIGFAGSATIQGQGPLPLSAFGADGSRQSGLHATMAGMLRDAGGSEVAGEDWQRGAPTPQGRPLAMNLTVYHTRVSAGFDAARSAASVRAIVRRHHTDLLYTGDNTRNRLTVLLDEQGGLLNRHVDRVEWAYDQPAPADAAEVLAQARELAQRLRIDVAQVGLLGSTVVREDGEWYHVAYAWRRRQGETGPMAMTAAPPVPQLDLAAAESIVQQHFGAVAADPARQTPAIVLSAAGVVLRTGYVQMHNGGLTRQALEAPLLAGLQAQDVMLQPVVQDSAPARTVLFVWEAAAPAAGPAMPTEVPVRGSR